VSRAIADTSIFIAREAGRPLGELPDEIAVSVVTAAELELGVLRALDAAVRAVRLQTLSRVRAEYPPLPIDDQTASCFARIADEELRAGRKLRRSPANRGVCGEPYGNLAAQWTSRARGSR
jgi:predicted nucleic acid-binding protein